jgi:FkbM family methyltransferase
MSDPRSLQYYAGSYLRLLRTFRNGLAIAKAHHQRLPCDCAVMWNGRRLEGPVGRGGLGETVVEIFGMEAYSRGGFYDPRPGHVVLDLGANIGIFAAWLAHSAKDIRVLTFEPSAENLVALKRNVAWWPGIEVYPFAVGGSHGRACLKVASRSIDHQLDVSQAGDITVLTLGEAADLAGTGSRIDLLKMDIEGSEADVFARPHPPALMSRFRKIAIEWHEHLRPGVLELLRLQLEPTHRIVAIDADDHRYGLLQAVAV